MAIPKYNEMFNTFLEILQDNKEHTTSSIRNEIIKIHKLTPDDLKETLNTGMSRFYNRVGWTTTYLKKAGLIKRIKSGVYKITETGIELINKNVIINDTILSKYDSFNDFLNTTNKDKKIEEKYNVTKYTPLEELEVSINRLNLELQDTILEELIKQSPVFLENLATKLLTKMGYGKQENSIVTVSSCDGGIDGIVLEDELGINNIYIQTKRYDKENSVSRPELQKFYGAMADESVKKGVFITTSYFAKPAIEYANKNSIILIDGIKLSHLMVKYNIGCTTENIYEIKKLDTDFFENE